MGAASTRPSPQAPHGSCTASLPAGEELSSQGATQKPWQMDLCEPEDLFQVRSPGAECFLAGRLRHRAVLDFSSPVGRKPFSTPAFHPPVALFQQQEPWSTLHRVGGGWKETAVPLPTSKTLSSPNF